jgi:ferredoxin
MTLPSFHITDDCTSCGACEGIAPRHFEPGDSGAYRCYRQPTTEQELSDCREAREVCPVEAILER